MARPRSTAKEAEVKQAAKVASLDELLAKKPQTKDVEIEINGEPRVLRFRSIGRKGYRELNEAHTVEPEGDDDEPQLNMEEFFKALVVESSFEPKLSFEALEQLDEVLNSAEFDLLVSAAIEVNTRSRINTWGKG